MLNWCFPKDSQSVRGPAKHEHRKGETWNSIPFLASCNAWTYKGEAVAWEKWWFDGFPELASTLPGAHMTMLSATVEK